MEWLAVTAGLAAVFVVALWLYLTRNRYMANYNLIFTYTMH